MASQDALLSLALSFSPQPTSRTPLTDAEYDRQIKSQVQSMNQVDRTTLLSCVLGGGDILVVRVERDR